MTWRIASGRREREGMDAGIGAKATVLNCMGGDGGEGNCASLQARRIGPLLEQFADPKAP